MFRSRWSKVLLAIATLVAASIAFAGWYRVHYSMSVARAFEVNDPHSAQRVLIATQGSTFKDSLVAEIVGQLKPRNVYLNVVDISALSAVNDGDWNAIVIVHTWEMRKPPADVHAFVERARNSGKLVVLATSGGGSFKIEGIDAISTASVIDDVPARAAEIVRRVDALLGRKTEE